jgi:membrane-associated phospholipid phosphatase
MKPLFKIWPILLVAIVAAYFMIDRPLCEFIYRHDVPHQCMSSIKTTLSLPKAITENSISQHMNLAIQIIDWPPLMSGLSPFLFLLGIALKPGKFKDLLLLMGISILLTFVLKNDLKWVFGRDWPLTWVHNNPSWISNHAYGFQWFTGKIFQGTEETGSFPSGHTAIAFASLLPIGLIYCRFLPLCIVLATLEGLSMVLFDYHFLSDVLAGALLGISCTLAVKTLVLPDKSPLIPIREL